MTRRNLVFGLSAVFAVLLLGAVALIRSNSAGTDSTSGSVPLVDAAVSTTTEPEPTCPSPTAIPPDCLSPTFAAAVSAEPRFDVGEAPVVETPAPTTPTTLSWEEQCRQDYACAGTMVTKPMEQPVMDPTPDVDENPSTFVPGDQVPGADVRDAPITPVNP